MGRQHPTQLSTSSSTMTINRRGRKRNWLMAFITAMTITFPESQQSWVSASTYDIDSVEEFVPWAPTNSSSVCLLTILNESQKEFDLMAPETTMDLIFNEYIDCPQGSYMNTTIVGAEDYTSHDLGEDIWKVRTNEEFTVGSFIHLNSTYSNMYVFNDTIFAYARVSLCNVMSRPGYCNPFDNLPSPKELTYGDRETQLINSTSESLFNTDWTKTELRLDPSKGPGIYSGYSTVTLFAPDGVKNGAFFVVNEIIVDSPLFQNRSFRLVMANAFSDNIIVLDQPAHILKVSYGLIVYVSVVCSVFGAIALACLIFIIYHHKHPVMTLAQGSFLAALAGSCFLAIVFSFAYLPLYDAFCTMTGPLVIFPLHVSNTIMIGRLWRVYGTLAAANLFGRRDSDPKEGDPMCSVDWGENFVFWLSILSRLPFTLSKMGRKKMKTKSAQRSNFRQTVTAKETTSLICVLSFPQLCLQLFGAAYYTRGLQVQLNAEEDMGRLVCTEEGRWVSQVGIGLVGLVSIIAITLAWIGRTLPSAFNEKNQVFLAGGVSAILTILCLPLVEFTDKPTNSPDIQVFLRSMLSIGVSATALFLLVVPRIRRVMSGEKVVMTRVLDARNTLVGKERVGSSGETTQNTIEANGRIENDEVMFDRIQLKEGDALPRCIEEDVLRLQEALRTVTNRCCDGRPLTYKDWQKLRDESNAMQRDLNRVQLLWEAEEGLPSEP